MSKVFVVTNQHGLFANKHKEWTDGRDPKQLFRCNHRDEAINLVFELSSKDIYLRAEAVSVALNDKKQPLVEVTAELPPESEISDEDADNTDATEASTASDSEQTPAELLTE